MENREFKLEKNLGQILLRKWSFNLKPEERKIDFSLSLF